MFLDVVNKVSKNLVGFFEHQYLKFKKRHVKNLTAIAFSDGHLDDVEKQLILKIGKQLGLKEKQILRIIETGEKAVFDDNLNKEEKLDQLFDMVNMMLIDGIVDPNELNILNRFCEKFEMDISIIDELVQYFRSEENIEKKGWTEYRNLLIEQFKIH